MDRAISPAVITTEHKIVYKVVLTGGPCAGKTTALARFRTFFENLGWKVYCAPEAATILFCGGIEVTKLNKKQIRSFQENVLKTIMQIEQTYFDLANDENRNCLIVCDRGTMDPSAFCSNEEWQEILKSNGWNTHMLRDQRYDQVVHLQTAAKGAEAFYQLINNKTRTEGIEQARDRDTKAAQVWVGHPCCDVIDNSTDFENKIRRSIEIVCRRLGNRLGVDVDDRLQAISKKRKFLVKSLPPIDLFPIHLQDFEIQHDYLLNSESSLQPRLKKRGQKGTEHLSNFMYTLTNRKIINNEKMELSKQLSHRDYLTLLNQRDPNRHPIQKIRRCFHWHGHYFQLDMFKTPSKHQDLLLLETYTTKNGEELKLPVFLEIVKEVTDDSGYSMYNLSVICKQLT